MGLGRGHTEQQWRDTARLCIRPDLHSPNAYQHAVANGNAHIRTAQCDAHGDACSPVTDSKATHGDARPTVTDSAATYRDACSPVTDSTATHGDTRPGGHSHSQALEDVDTDGHSHA